MIRLISLACAVAASLALTSILSNSAIPAWISLGIFVTVAQVVVCYSRAGGITITLVPCTLINGVLIGAVAIWPRVADNSTVSTRLYADEAQLVQAMLVGLAFTSAITIGSLLGHDVRIDTSRATGKASLLDNINSAQLIAFGSSGLAVTFGARGLSLWEGGYLSASGPEWLVSIANAMTLPSILSLALAANRQGKLGNVARILLALWVIVLFGRATRSIAAVPLLLLLATWLSGKDASMRRILLTFSATLTLLQLPLALRANANGVGIKTLGLAIIENPSTALSERGIEGTLGNVMFSGPLTAVVRLREMPDGSLATSLNPLPGALTDWPSLSRLLRIDATTPYGGLGELAAHGPITLALVGVFAGLIFAILSRVAASQDGSIRIIVVLISLGLATFFGVRVLQYNLRSSTRLLWYAIALVGFLYVVGSTHARLGLKRSGRGDHTTA